MAIRGNRPSAWWTEARRALLCELYPTWMDIEEITRRLNELPGAVLDAARVGTEARRLGAKRPDGYRNVAAQGSYQHGWKHLVGERKATPRVLRKFDLENIEHRNRDNDDLLRLVKEVRRIWRDTGGKIDVTPNEMVNIELRNKGKDDFEDLMAELRRFNAIKR